MNGFEDYRKVELETEEGEWKLTLDNMKIWGGKVWEVVSEKGGEVGEEHVR